MADDRNDNPDWIEMEWTTSREYVRQANRYPELKARQVRRRKREYRLANSDTVRLHSRRNMINRENRLNHFLITKYEIKRVTSYPKSVFRGIIRFGRLGQVIEERLREIGEPTYPAAWALLETMYYLASGSTYKRTADMFANGSFRQARVVRVTQRLLAYRLPAPTVICIVLVHPILLAYVLSCVLSFSDANRYR